MKYWRRKIQNKKGVTTVFLAVILATVLSLAAFFFEGACSAAAKSISEGLLDCAGRSALSEYHTGLQKNYGIFARENDKEGLTADLRYYIEESLNVNYEGKNQLNLTDDSLDPVRLFLIEAEANADEYSLLSPEILEKQILDIMKGRTEMSGVTFLSRWPTLETGLGELLRANMKIEDQKKKAEKAEREQEKLDSREEESEDGGGGNDSEKKRRKQAKKRLRNAISNILKQNEQGTAEEESDRILRNEQEKNWLPSHVSGVSGAPDISGLFEKETEEAIKESTVGLRDSLWVNEYLLLKFKNRAMRSGGTEEPLSAQTTFFENEVEYILCGHDSDTANLRQVKAELFAVRTLCNLAHIYSNEEKRELTLEAGTAIAPGPGAAAFQFLIASLWAGLESREDVGDLISGEQIPLIKSAEDWKTDLFSVENGGKIRNNAARDEKNENNVENGGENEAGSESRIELEYEDYLRLFLLAENRECRLLRALDLMQLNTRLTSDREFLAQNYCGGFSCRAEFGRKTGMYAPFSRIGGYQIEKIQLY